MSAKKELDAPLISRTSEGLRDAIFDEIDAVRNGVSNPTRANAVAKLASGIVETVRMELEVMRHTQTFVGAGGVRGGTPLCKALQLGSSVGSSV